MALEDMLISTESLSTSGYGTDPNLVTPSVPWQKTLSENQRKLAAALSDIILPAIDEFPAPSQMGIADFLDEWLSAPYPQQQKDSELISSGFVLINSQSQRMFGLDFVKLTENQKRTIVDGVASSAKADQVALGREFFKRFRYLVVGGYFTSYVGFNAIGYVGNVPMQNYPGISREVKRILNEELVRLGLPQIPDV